MDADHKCPKREYQRSPVENATAIQQTSDIGYILADGDANSYGASAEFWLITTDADGNAPTKPTP